MEQSLHSTLTGLRLRGVIGGGGGGGDRKLTLGSEGVVGSSSVPSVCGIPLQAGDEGCLVLVVWFCPLWPAPLER